MHFKYVLDADPILKNVCLFAIWFWKYRTMLCFLDCLWEIIVRSIFRLSNATYCFLVLIRAQKAFQGMADTFQKSSFIYTERYIHCFSRFYITSLSGLESELSNDVIFPRDVIQKQAEWRFCNSKTPAKFRTSYLE